MIKARIVQHHGRRYRAGPLARHLDYLARDGVTKDGREARLFNGRSDDVDAKEFASRCEDDRHHFRFIISPEDAPEMADLRSFARELMGDVASDLGTSLDWVGVDHWNTDNPHLHILVRGKADDGADLVIDRDYISQAMRESAQARVTLELGPRSEREIALTLAKEVDAERWTSLDRRLRQMADRSHGVIDLRPSTGRKPGDDHHLLIGRVSRLERMGLAERVAPAMWTMSGRAEASLRDLAMRTDIIKTMHRAMLEAGRQSDLSSFDLHGEAPAEPVLGRLSGRGLHDELTGTAYAIVEGVDGRTHHLRFDDLEMTGDAPIGAIVETRIWQDRAGLNRLSLATRSDLSLRRQIDASGATWLDRELVSAEALPTGGGFGSEVRDALKQRREKLVEQGVAARRGGRIAFPPAMIAKLREKELESEATRIARATGLAHRPSAPGEVVRGIYREHLTLASGRFAMIDDGLGFQLVPWRPALDRDLGRQLLGNMGPGGRVDWSLGRSNGLGL